MEAGSSPRAEWRCTFRSRGSAGLAHHPSPHPESLSVAAQVLKHPTDFIRAAKRYCEPELNFWPRMNTDGEKAVRPAYWKSGKKDCRVSVDGAPTIFCFHSSCIAAVAEANRRLRQEQGGSPWEICLPGGRMLRSVGSRPASKCSAVTRKSSLTRTRSACRVRGAMENCSDWFG